MISGSDVTLSSLTIKSNAVGFRIQNVLGTSTYVSFYPQGGLQIDPGGLSNSISASTNIVTHGDIISHGDISASAGHFLGVHANTGGGASTYLRTSGDAAGGNLKLEFGDLDDNGSETKLIINDNDERVTVTKHLKVQGSQVDFTALPTSDPEVAGRLFQTASAAVGMTSGFQVVLISQG